MLITTLGLAATMVALSAAILTASVIEIKAAERFEQRTVAFHWAEGAIDQTLVNLRTNPLYSGLSAVSATNGKVSGNYSTTVTALGNNVYRINANGAISGSTAVLAQSRSVETYASVSSSGFSGVLFANQVLAIRGNAQTDSYDSRNGAYSSSTVRSGGHIGSNRTERFAITIAGNVRVKGNAVVGPSADPSQVILMTGNASISGTQTAAASATELAPVVIPGDAVDLGSISVMTNQTLAGGTYRVSSLTVSGNGRLNFSGDTTLYVSGAVTVYGNASLTANNLPTNLKLKVVGGHQVNFTGNTSFYGSVYAPLSMVALTGNNNLFGSVMSDSIAVNGNARVHYDEALAGTGGGSNSSNDVTYWAEL